MLRKFAIRTYSHIFQNVALFHLVPFHWDPHNMEMTLPNPKRNKHRRKWFWPFTVAFQLWHFGYLMWKLWRSIQEGETVPFIVFQLVWNIIFIIPICAQVSIYLRAEEIPRCISLWLRLESEIDAHPPRALQSFVTLFTPVAVLHWLSHGFLFFENPNRPQYLYTLWYSARDLRRTGTEPALGPVILFGVLELVVNYLNWLLVLFFTFISIGFSNSLASWLWISRNLKDERRALGLYTRAQRFTLHVNEALHVILPVTKVILALLLITSVYNTAQMSLPLIPYMLMPLTTLAGTIFFLCCYPPMGDFHATSEAVLHHWRHRARDGFRMKVLMVMYRKHWISFRPIGISVGSFYVVQQKTVLVFFSIVAYYVMTLLCSA